MQSTSEEDAYRQLQRHVVKGLYDAAATYLRAGLDLFHQHRKTLHSHLEDYSDFQISGSPSPQAVFANLTLAIELSLKALIAIKKLKDIFIFTEPFEELLRVLDDQNSHSIETLEHGIDKYQRMLQSRKTKTLRLEKCVSKACTEYPELAPLLEADLGYLYELRNRSVHFFMADIMEAEVERAAYTALSIFGLLGSKCLPRGLFDLVTSEIEIHPNTWFVWTRDDEMFDADYRIYREEVSRSVKQKLGEARKRAASAAPPSCQLVPPSRWEHLVVPCPVCEADAIANGKTEIETRGYYSSYAEQEEPEVLEEDYLVFTAESLRCPRCGLALNDPSEFYYAHLQPKYDRTDELSDYRA